MLRTNKRNYHQPQRSKALIISALLLLSFSMCRKADPAALDDESRFDPRLSGGMSTFFDDGSGSLGTPIPGLSARDQFVHEVGDKLFEQPFVAAPAPLYGGLGPVFNNISCGNCHHNDGFGLPTFGQLGSSLLMRLSLPGEDEHGGPVAVPGFGGQLQNMSLLGSVPEALVDVSYTSTDFAFPDGSTTTMHEPHYTISSPYIPMPGNVLTSVRLGPSVFGLGLLENVTEGTMQSFEDPSDANNDGIKGHINYVYNPYTKKKEPGKFGKKANTSSLLVQVATAFQEDMGLTSYVRPTESVHGQAQMAQVSDGGKYELADSMLDAVTFYVRSLSVPARRNVTDATVLQGEKLFKQMKCAVCHKQTMYTGVDVQFPALSNQRIHPYTDLLVHDMGAGLADNRPDFQAGGTEWRTAPLWGIGMFERATGAQYYLHDGRAHSVTEAILWHGGEAQGSKDAFVLLSSSDRKAVLAFLASL